MMPSQQASSQLTPTLTASSGRQRATADRALMSATRKQATMVTISHWTACWLSGMC